MASITKSAPKIAPNKNHKAAAKGVARQPAKSAQTVPKAKTIPKAASVNHQALKQSAKSSTKTQPATKAQPVEKSKVQVAKPSKSVAPKSTRKPAPVQAPVKAAAAKPMDKKPGIGATAAVVKAAVVKAPAIKVQAVKAPVTKAPAAPAAKAPQTKAPVTKPVVAPVIAQAPIAQAPIAKAAISKAPIANAPAAKAVVQPTAPVLPKAATHPAVSPQAMAAKAPQATQRAMPATLGKPSQTKLTAPAARPAMPSAAPANPAAIAAAVAAAKKPVSSRHGFKTNEFVVYPAHGVGRIVGIEEQEIAGISLELFVIQFEKDKMTLRVPTSKLQSVGMRKLAEQGIVNRAMETLKGKARIKRTMWSRRAQEYEAKINSGDLIAIAEVVRDLYRSEAQPEQSYSERQLYEAALDRMAREIAAVDKIDERGAMQRITEVLSKSARGRRAAEEEAAASASAEVKAA